MVSKVLAVKFSVATKGLEYKTKKKLDCREGDQERGIWGWVQGLELIGEVTQSPAIPLVSHGMASGVQGHPFFQTAFRVSRQALTMSHAADQESFRRVRAST